MALDVIVRIDRKDRDGPDFKKVGIANENGDTIAIDLFGLGTMWLMNPPKGGRDDRRDLVCMGSDGKAGKVGAAWPSRKTDGWDVVWDGFGRFYLRSQKPMQRTTRQPPAMPSRTGYAPPVQQAPAPTKYPDRSYEPPVQSNQPPGYGRPGGYSEESPPPPDGPDDYGISLDDDIPF